MTFTPEELHELFIAAADGDEHDSGTCVEFALAAHACFPDSTIWVCDREYPDEGEIFTTTLSHAIVSIDGVDLDARGKEADENWAARWDEEPSYEEMDFNWRALSAKELVDLSLKVGNKPPNQELINSLIKRFQEELAKRDLIAA